MINKKIIKKLVKINCIMMNVFIVEYKIRIRYFIDYFYFVLFILYL